MAKKRFFNFSKSLLLALIIHFKKKSSGSFFVIELNPAPPFLHEKLSKYDNTKKDRIFRSFKLNPILVGQLSVYTLLHNSHSIRVRCISQKNNFSLCGYVYFISWRTLDFCGKICSWGNRFQETRGTLVTARSHSMRSAPCSAAFLEISKVLEVNKTYHNLYNLSE